MELSLRQGFEYQGDDWWKWWIWLDAPPETLDRVDRVVYTLHPTFPNPVRQVKDRSTSFRLETSGWGVFTIFAKVYFTGEDSPENLSHDLELVYPDGHATLA